MARPPLALLAIIGVLLSQGFHVAALQGFAWARMFVDYQERLPAIEAMERTLAGNEPCGVCWATLDLQTQAQEFALKFHGQTPSILALSPIETPAFRLPKPSLSPRQTLDALLPAGCILDSDPPPPRTATTQAA